VASERKLGMEAGKAWSAFAEAVIVYTDRGVSNGMQWGIDAAVKRGIPIEYRSIE